MYRKAILRAGKVSKRRFQNIQSTRNIIMAFDAGGGWNAFHKRYLVALKRVPSFARSLGLVFSVKNRVDYSRCTSILARKGIYIYICVCVFRN